MFKTLRSTAQHLKLLKENSLNSVVNKYIYAICAKIGSNLNICEPDGAIYRSVQENSTFLVATKGIEIQIKQKTRYVKSRHSKSTSKMQAQINRKVFCTQSVVSLLNFARLLQ